MTCSSFFSLPLRGAIAEKQHSTVGSTSYEYPLTLWTNVDLHRGLKIKLNSFNFLTCSFKPLY